MCYYFFSLRDFPYLNTPGRTTPLTNPVETRIQNFVDELGTYPELEIDGETEKGLKILNHRLHCAKEVSMEGILNQRPGPLVEALSTGVKDKLYGITRIVGYYSRTTNWNKSKLGELKDRHKGNYSVGTLKLV